MHIVLYGSACVLCMAVVVVRGVEAVGVDCGGGGGVCVCCAQWGEAEQARIHCMMVYSSAACTAR